MNILVSGLSMSYLSGQPLYCYELCLELARQGHSVTMISDWNGPIPSPDGEKMRNNLTAKGVNCISFREAPGEQDLIIASEKVSENVLNTLPNTPALNVVHSEYEYEDPISDRPQIIKYVCIRHSIAEHIIKEHGIPKDKCVVIYNGVDRDRFKPKKKTKKNYYKIVVPCTLDPLREKFLNYMIDNATEKKRVFIFGTDCGLQLHENKWATISPPKFDIEEEIADADEVAGIILGRVNLEAWSCGVPSRIFNPETLDNRLYSPPIDFDFNHNIKNVVSKLISIAGNLDDITVVIPHHSARPQLARLLESIKNMKYVSIIKGGSFARNCNTGVSTAKTKYVLITNDDTTFNPGLLLRAMVSANVDICGATPDQGVKGFDIVDGQLELNPEGHYPSGALLLIKTDVFNKLKGFDEIFINGAEDIDLFMRAEKEGFTVKRIDDIYHHDESQSEGRFDKCVENELIFNKRWRGICHIGVGE